MGGESLIPNKESIPQIEKAVTMDNDSVNKQSVLSLTEASENSKESPERNGSMEKESSPTIDENPIISVKSNGEVKEPVKSGRLIYFITLRTGSLAL